MATDFVAVTQGTSEKMAVVFRVRIYPVIISPAFLATSAVHSENLLSHEWSISATLLYWIFPSPMKCIRDKLANTDILVVIKREMNEKDGLKVFFFFVTLWTLSLVIPGLRSYIIYKERHQGSAINLSWDQKLQIYFLKGHVLRVF